MAHSTQTYEHQNAARNAVVKAIPEYVYLLGDTSPWHATFLYLSAVGIQK